MGIIFDIDHEAGDLTEYNSSVTDSGDLSAHADAALASTGYGLKCVLDDVTAIYGQLTLSATYSDFRVRFYIDPNSLTMAQYDQFTAFQVYASASPWSIFKIDLGQGGAGGGEFYLSCTPYNDTAKLSSDIEAITDAPHYVEVYGHRATNNSSSDGSYQWWIDGVSKGTWTSVDNYDLFALFQLVRIGAIVGIEAGTSGTFYMDQLVIRDDSTEIGAYSPPAGGVPLSNPFSRPFEQALGRGGF